jgi:hypothetical protein
MGDMIEWLLQHVPWWFWAGSGLVVAGMLWRVVGYRAALGALAALGIWALRARDRQSGWTARELKEQQDADAFTRRADEARGRADRRNAADGGQLRDDDGFRRD